jgi:type II secretory pathway component PulF
MTLNDLIALNAEIAALVRAGVPLDQGLAALGEDMPGRLGRAATLLAERTARGEPLDQSLMELAGPMPPVYRAIVQAGVRAGRLPAALEAVASSARRLSETCRAVVVAVAYPLMIFALVWCGLAIFTSLIAPQLAAKSATTFGLPGQRFFAPLAVAGQWAWYWGPVVPVVVALILALWWYVCTRATVLHGGRASALLGSLPWMGRMLRCSRSATFLEVLALLVEHGTPLGEALRLAAEASGDRRTRQAAGRLVDTLQTGQMQGDENDGALPPLMNWLIFATNRDGALLPALKHAAAAYHRRAQYQADMVGIFLPVLLTVVVAGGLVACYAMTLFIPYAAMLRALGS